MCQVFPMKALSLGSLLADQTLSCQGVGTRRDLGGRRRAHFVDGRNEPVSSAGHVQLPQIAQRPLAGTAGRSHRLYQRPVGVILTVLAALMRSQKHLPASLSSAAVAFKGVCTTSLFLNSRLQRQDLSRFQHQKSWNLALSRRTSARQRSALILLSDLTAKTGQDGRGSKSRTGRGSANTF
jgi:hypothetical protein